MGVAARREARTAYGDARCGEAESACVAREVAAWRRATGVGKPGVARACALELQEAQNGEADRTQERATQRPEPDTPHAGTTLARKLLGMAGGSETRASRDADDEQILGERESDASEHGARLIRQWRVGAHVSIRISSIRADKTRLGCASLAQDSICHDLVNPHDIGSSQPRRSHTA
jgi:hypothetical protein